MPLFPCADISPLTADEQKRFNDKIIQTADATWRDYWRKDRSYRSAIVVQSLVWLDSDEGKDEVTRNLPHGIYVNDSGIGI